MNIIFYEPPIYLKKYIRYFWSCDLADYRSEEIIYFDNYADKYPRLVFQVDDRPQLKSDENKDIPKTYICGIETYPSFTSVQANFSHFGVSFNPFALTEIFKVAPNLVVNQNVDLNDLGYTNLLSKLADAKCHARRIEIMCRFVEDQTTYKRIVNPDVIQIVLNNELVEQRDLFNLQKKYKVTERTMERLFKSAIGVSPKTFQRLARFEKTLALLKSHDYNNSANVGYLLDYTDQSHFIKDFKQFTNITPAQFRRNNFLLSESSAFISKKSSS
ncbi:helix-turn-helix domain-containing protein [Pedobacter insulae]|uniref:AraC-type DNA-binding protein n=1 Tax=Pedobacter insulae TaxID=414048 RepID=A0A1I2UWW4_9SPHI|nr:helix-turn-helix domain-containing protein [Pedobacter insulae]SFG80337.1 AraC-type DNA-binding protein [Pedobacter insulae]